MLYIFYTKIAIKLIPIISGTKLYLDLIAEMIWPVDRLLMLPPIEEYVICLLYF